jgi:ubiquinone/menaquinone biosynthesis C-methylase UbiE
MDVRTLLYDDNNAQSLANHYEMAEMGDTHRTLLRHLPEGGRVLEVGCGSG